MREDLKNTDWFLYGLAPADIDHTIEIVRQIFGYRESQIERQWEHARKESPNDADDIMDDIAHYSYTELEHLWPFALWRLQGVFEGLIVQEFLELDQLFGLKAKLRAMTQAGYPLERAQHQELMEWAKLRNALSHQPPEHYQTAHLTEADLVEYGELLKRVLAGWYTHKAENS